MPSSDVTIIPTFEENGAVKQPDTLDTQKFLKEPSIFKNPDTGDKVLLIIIIMAISLGIGTYLYKRKESRKI